MKVLNMLAGIGVITIMAIVAKTVKSGYELVYGPTEIHSYIRFKDKNES